MRIFVKGHIGQDLLKSTLTMCLMCIFGFVRQAYPYLSKQPLGTMGFGEQQMLVFVDEYSEIFRGIYLQ